MAAAAVLVTAGRAGTELTGAITKPDLWALSETSDSRKLGTSLGVGETLLPGEPHVRISVLSWS